MVPPSPVNNFTSMRPQFFESKAGLDQLLIDNKTLKSGINQHKQQQQLLVQHHRIDRSNVRSDGLGGAAIGGQRVIGENSLYPMSKEEHKLSLVNRERSSQLKGQSSSNNRDPSAVKEASNKIAFFPRHSGFPPTSNLRSEHERVPRFSVQKDMVIGHFKQQNQQNSNTNNKLLIPIKVEGLSRRQQSEGPYPQNEEQKVA